MSKKKTKEKKSAQATKYNNDSSDVFSETAGIDDVTSSTAFDTENATVEENGQTKAKADTDDDTAQKLAAMNERHLRLLAEYDNYRKRSVREVEDAHHIATVNLIQELLPILDNLDRATEHRDDKTTLEEYTKGITLIEDQLRDALAKAGLKYIEVVGQPFDPHFHEAVMQMDSEDYDSGIVSQEVQKGFLLGDRVIRHSKVVVAK